MWPNFIKSNFPNRVQRCAKNWTFFSHFQNAGRQDATRESITGDDSLTEYCVLIYQSIYTDIYYWAWTHLSVNPKNVQALKFGSRNRLLNIKNLLKIFNVLIKMGYGPIATQIVTMHGVIDLFYFKLFSKLFECTREKE